MNLDGYTAILQVLCCGISWGQKVQFLGSVRRPRIHCSLGELAFLRISNSSYRSINPGFSVCEFNKATLVNSCGNVRRMLVFFGFQQWLESLVVHLFLRVFLSLQATFSCFCTINLVKDIDGMSRILSLYFIFVKFFLVFWCFWQEYRMSNRIGLIG